MREFEVILRTPWGGPWRAFREPAAIVMATRVEDVAGCLDDLERGVRRDGYYAAGFITYEAAAAFGLPAHAPAAGGLPPLCFGLFTPDRVTFQGRPRPSGSFEVGEWVPSIDRGAYMEAIRRIKDEIAEGNTYQINYTFRLRAPWSGDPVALLQNLDAAQQGDWGALVRTGGHVVCSASPELFFSLDRERLVCRPMKGTAPRGLWTEIDAVRGAALRASAKDRAENVMIVDLVRNDIGRIAAIGTVKVESLFEIERYPRHWQMTSTVSGQVPAVTIPALFEAMFPCGSVTGAPKHRSMQIIRELEDTPRGIYTGAIGYLSPHGRGHFNVAIRTVTLDEETGQAEFGVGSGVVWDSVDRDEYDECLLKASVVAAPLGAFRLLESLSYSPAGGFALLDRHIGRLRASAAYFGFPFDAAEAVGMLEKAAADVHGLSKVRLLLARDGALVCEALDLQPLPGRPLRARLALDPVDPSDVFLYHKTTARRVYEAARADLPEAEAVILWNRKGEVTEGTEANVVALIGGRRVTPPIECGLLPGTLRGELLDTGQIVEERITVEQLRAATRIWLINSVRGWMDVTLD